MIVSLLCVVLVAAGVVLGVRRGFVRVVLETAVLIAATTSAWFGAGVLARVLDGSLGWARAFTYAFVALWIVLAIGLALITRAVLMPRLDGVQLAGGLDRPAGGLINGLKVAAVLIIVVTAYVSLPLPQRLLDVVTAAPLPQAIIAQTAPLQEWWETIPGAALSQTVTRYVITADPKSTERVDPEFTTTAVQPAPDLEIKMLALVNRERTARGLAALQVNPKAQAVARQYATTMLAAGFFPHIDNDNRNPFDRLKAGGVTFGAAGENLALAANLQRAHVGLMQSPGHRANILSDDYSTVGIGVIDAGQYGLMVVQEFTD